jgi:hypothetical protein
MKFFDYQVAKVEITTTDIKVILQDGRESTKPIKNFPLLYKASTTERNNFVVIGGYALYWEKLGEDLSIAGFFN